MARHKVSLCVSRSSGPDLMLAKTRVEVETKRQMAGPGRTDSTGRQADRWRVLKMEGAIQKRGKEARGPLMIPWPFWLSV